MTDDKEVRYKQKRKNNQELFYITYLPLIQMKNATMICDDDDEDETFTAEDSKYPSLFSLLVSLHRFVQTFLFSSPLVSDGQACFHCILHHRTSLFSRTPKRQCLCARMCVCLSARLDSFRLRLSRSLARPRSLSLSLASSLASQRGSVGEPKRSVSQKQRRRQKDSGFKLLLGTRGGPKGGFPTAF